MPKLKSAEQTMHNGTFLKTRQFHPDQESIRDGWMSYPKYCFPFQLVVFLSLAPYMQSTRHFTVC